MEADLQRTVIRALIAFAAGRGPGGSNLLIRYPNTKPKRPTRTASTASNDPLAHLEIDFLPATPARFGVNDGASRYQWLTQVSVVVSVDFGEIAALAHLDALRAAFPCEYEFIGTTHRYQVTRPLAVSPGISTEGWLAIPGALRLQAFD